MKTHSYRSAGRARLAVWATILLLGSAHVSWAATGGSNSGSVTDPTGAIVQGAELTLVNDAQQTT